MPFRIPNSSNISPLAATASGVDNDASVTGTLNARGNTHVLRKAGAAARFFEFRGNQHGAPDMSVIRPKLGDAQVASALRSRAFVPNQAFFLTTDGVAAIERTVTTAPPSKAYVGYNRVSQQLTHIATSLFHVMTSEAFHDKWAPGERGKINPIEIQLAVIGESLHVSSNFHGDKLVRALRIAVDAAEPKHEKQQERTSSDNKHDVRAANCLRHFRKFHQLVSATPKRFGDVERQLRGEIVKKMGIPEGATTMSPDMLARQGAHALDTIRRVLTRESELDFPSLVVHAPPPFERTPDNPLPPKVTETRHAEQNIEDDLGAQAQRQYDQAIKELGLPPGTPVVIPMAGKFVACAVCAEAEHAMRAEGEGGVFDPSNTSRPFILHRSGDRIGHAYGNEVQHLATNALHPDKQRGAARARTIGDNFALTPEKTLAWRAKVAAGMIANRTDSESDVLTDQR